MFTTYLCHTSDCQPICLYSKSHKVDITDGMYYSPRKLLEETFPKGSEYVYPLLPFFNLSTHLKHSALLMRGGKMHLL